MRLILEVMSNCAHWVSNAVDVCRLCSHFIDVLCTSAVLWSWNLLIKGTNVFHFVFYFYSDSVVSRRCSCPLLFSVYTSGVRTPPFNPSRIKALSTVLQYILVLCATSVCSYIKLSVFNLIFATRLHRPLATGDLHCPQSLLLLLYLLGISLLFSPGIKCS